MGTKYGVVDKVNCTRAYEYLQGAFSFSSSAEGEAFWYAICDRLRMLSRSTRSDDRPDEPCWRVKEGAVGNAQTIERLQREVTSRDALIALRDAEIQKQAQEIVRLTRELKIERFCNFGR